MNKQSTSSKYILTNDKKLEIHEYNKVYRAKIPVRFYLNPIDFLKNIVFTIIKSKRRLKAYSVLDQKDKTKKTLYLTRIELQQVWNHQVGTTTSPKAVSIKKNR